MKKAERIKTELRLVLESFLNYGPNYPQYKAIAEAVGYTGDEPEKVKSALFSVNDEGQIGFVVAELHDMFFEFQVIQNVIDKEPFKTLLEENPEIKDEIVVLAKKIIAGQEVANEDIEKLAT
jgi:hypothetical protein